MNIASFKGRICTTTQLRELHNTGNLVRILNKLAEDGEIVCVGKIATHGKSISAWKEVGLVFSTTNVKKKAEEKNDGLLPGWRAVYPFMFSDPKLKGKRSVLCKGEL